MFLSRRATQAEYFDSDRPAAEMAEFYLWLGRANRFFGFAQPFQRLLPKLFGDSACRSLSILDVGAGDGSLGKVLTQWAAARGWDWRFTNLDLHPHKLNSEPKTVFVTGSALALHFADASFDLVIASNMTHHLNDADAAQHLREAWRVARLAVLLVDMHRNLALYTIIWLLMRLRGFPKTFRGDALLSVKRAWRVPELQRLAAQAGLNGAQVRLYFGARVLLLARKSAPLKTMKETR